MTRFSTKARISAASVSTLSLTPLSSTDWLTSGMPASARRASARFAPGVTSWVALHANHAGEFSPAARRAIARLIDAGIPLVSQSVLLKGVNDDVETLDALMRAFVENRIKPYYLHHPDLAAGTSHFRVSIARGRALMRDLRARLSGLALPTYVLDIPGGHAKVPLLSDDVEDMGEGRWRVRDHKGAWHAYADH